MASNNEQRVNQAIGNKYQHVEKTKKDSMSLLNHYRGLSAKLERFVFNDGQDKEMLNLEGTIPVPYKGSTYNIPICLWLLDNHPHSAPMAYVKPTPDMLVKASRHVDQNGKIYLPYLHEWNPMSSDLVGLVQMMIMTFSEMPPVYAKPKGVATVTVQQSAATPYSTTPYSTQPGAGGAYMPPYSQSGSAGYPPYPGAGYPPSTTASYPTPYPPSYPTGAAGATVPPPYGVTPYPNPNDVSGAGPTPPTNTGTITEEHIRVSLVSSVGDKVRGRLRERYGDAQAEVAVLRQQKADLERGRDKLSAMVNKLTAEQSEVVKSVRVLREREGELRLLVEQSQATQHELDLDEAVTTTAPLYRQLVNAYAEEQATQDAIYYLGEALRRSAIDTDTFLRHVRALSRQQYQLRSTMTLCRQKANLPG